MRDHSSEPDLRIVATMHRLEGPALAVTAAVAAAVLVLWLMPTALTSGFTGWSKMVPATGLTLLAAVASLVLSDPQRSPAALRTSHLLAVGVAAVGVTVLTLYAIGYQPFGAAWTKLPSPQTAGGLLLVGLACANVNLDVGPGSKIADLSVIGLVGLVLFVLAGYVFYVDQLVGNGKTNLTSRHTLACLLLLTLVLIARRAQAGRMLAFFIGSGIGSQITRLALPIVIVMPFIVFGLIGYLDRNAIVPASYVRAIAAPLQVLGIIAIIAFMGKYINRLERDLRRQSLTDELTGVFNRRGFHAVADFTVRNAARSKNGLLLFYFDIDSLKQANDRFGHEVGSQLIARFAQLLTKSFRKSDIIARIGGDEFVVLANGDVANAAELLDRLHAKVAEENMTGALPFPLAYSTGHIQVPKVRPSSIDELTAQADQVMYEQKRLKRQAA